ncbi:IclR family transcriptional regulator [Fusobacterium sp.]|uniref:IclR family transcriptional regulator n=1 Tax=Fusobacterium sp. TaxID=68766 RepID=UPI0028FEC46A|nr:IclR family transcriptional regulator [Fusobacterium sp.]MDU1910967.1 IclR family transcriptional regulator [Fusobacterium sp.]
MTKEKKSDKDTLQTVEKALDVLYLLSESNYISAKDVEEKMGMSTTAAYRLLSTLTSKNFLRRNENDKKYYLGEKILVLGYRAAREQKLTKILFPIMEKIRQELQVNVILTMNVGNKSFCMEKLEHNKYSSEIRIAMDKGGAYTLHKGGSNRTLLAFMPEEEKKQYITSLDITEEEKNELTQIMEKIKKEKYDYSHGTMTPELFSVGVPLFKSNGDILACLSIGGIHSSLTEEHRKNYINKLKAIGEQIQEMLKMYYF